MMEARHSSVAKDVRLEDVVQPMEGVETGSDASIVPPPTEPNVIPTENVLPSSLPTVLSADATEGP